MPKTKKNKKYMSFEELAKRRGSTVEQELALFRDLPGVIRQGNSYLIEYETEEELGLGEVSQSISLTTCSEILKIPESAVIALIKNGELKHVTNNGGQYQIPVKAVRDYYVKLMEKK